MLVTICTPTFNRAYTLPRLYNSLLDQSDKRFEWIIIDDGSTDDTKDLVRSWIEEKKLNIMYFRQENSGKHVALNKGMASAKGLLFTCLDSDDWLYENAIEKVNEKWLESADNSVAGIIALDSYENGEIIGSQLPCDLKQANWIDLIYKFSMRGDKAYFFVTEVIKSYPFPANLENKHMPPSYQYYLISNDYDLLMLNEPLKYVEYLDDGISKKRYEKYIVAADNFSEYRYEIHNLIPSLKRRIINLIHFNATQLLGKKKFVFQSKRSNVLRILTKPAGILLAVFIKVANKIKNN
ncbi:glycosyltransferase family 2 protein [Alkalibacillus haloalkaliphilus]|uniref:Glycosyltransferase 2-like domain-containing protein n=1 Tax=Alkalibacillus haloalkaliphilus TaxID=94136 RepID=A0A511W6P2_9BACI|nr:glycosyltransferase family 2 protein [Alkalibacillus haloalkaliphilus]GEN46667.1 hypothetical protein AHA02nite_24430 [Alkalibacillus haloalkaliphilus]